jgi:hypothetical protein
MEGTRRITDPLQRGYRYECTQPTGKNFAPDFKPELTPEQMLALGVFGGNYFEGKIDEYPRSWFRNAKISTTGKRDAALNYFGVNASQSRAEWQKKGWMHPNDPRGWFQWYCRYYLGRRMPLEDARQITRWKKMVRHAAQVRANCRPRDYTCRPRQRQALLHWAYDSTKI